ncbi:MAG: hypothetical protein OET41_11415 [Xanthomonadales bacterium]|jgi:hypothetical protein|nr:hypothetical protein [Xanthomonadales bacterium]
MHLITTALSAAIILLAASINVSAQPHMKDPLWDRSTAMQFVDKARAMDSLKPMYEMARSGDEAGLMRALTGMSSDPDLTAPSRDYMVYSFTLGLGDMRADAVSSEVMGWLAAYKPATWVAHEEHPRMAVPLFNVRAAAQGVANGWERQKALDSAERALGEQPAQFISEYLAATQAGQRGYIDALERVPFEKTLELSRLALEMLAGSPELTHLAARAAIASGSSELLRRSIALGQGPGLARAFKDAAAELSAEESASLLEDVMEKESDSKAALAIALLAPGTLADPAVRDLMFNAMADQNLGASVALVLGSSADPEIQSRLSEIATGGAGLEQQRAQLAISFKPARRVD